MMISAAAAAALVAGTMAAPAGGEPAYLTVVLVLGCGAVVFAPLILTGHGVLGSRRLDLLPLSATARWSLRLALSNPLRSLLAAALLLWGIAVALARAASPLLAPLHALHVAAWVVAALAFSQLLEDVIRHRRAVAVHQLAFLLALASWPILFEYLRDERNFVPLPGWARGPLAPFLVASPSAPAPQLLALGAPLLLIGSFLALDRWFLRHHASRPAAAPTSARWTAAVARALALPAARDPLLVKELLVPLRFLFLRMSLVFVALSAAAAFVWGIPYLLLSLAFWWQPLSTNGLGPDVGDGEIRYQLIGYSRARVLRRRLLALVVTTAAVVAGVAVVCGLAGWIAPPTVGPRSLIMYPLVFAYSLSMLPLWAVAGDRYSLRYPDRLEMQTLLPERQRSGGAGAVILLLVMWFAVLLGALASLGLGFAIVRVVAHAPLGIAGIAAAVALSAGGNLGAYAVHARSWKPR
jgi:hypothetical protein